MTAGRAPASSILSRPRQRRELERGLEEILNSLRTQDANVEVAAREAEEAALEVKKLEAEVEASRRRQIEMQAAEHSAQLEVERQKRLIEWHAGRLGEFQDEQNSADSQRDATQQAIIELEATTAEAADFLAKLTTELNQQSLDEAQELAAYWTMRSAVAQQSAGGGAAAIERTPAVG